MASRRNSSNQGSNGDFNTFNNFNNYVVSDSDDEESTNNNNFRGFSNFNSNFNYSSFNPVNPINIYTPVQPTFNLTRESQSASAESHTQSDNRTWDDMYREVYGTPVTHEQRIERDLRFMAESDMDFDNTWSPAVSEDEEYDYDDDDETANFVYVPPPPPAPVNNTPAQHRPTSTGDTCFCLDDESHTVDRKSVV